MEGNPIGNAMNYMTYDMKDKLGNYMLSLESRYGDPRVYQMEREQMIADETAVLHNEARSKEALLASTYNGQREAVRRAHASRTREYQETRPGSSQPRRKTPSQSPS